MKNLIFLLLMVVGISSSAVEIKFSGLPLAAPSAIVPNDSFPFVQDFGPVMKRMKINDILGIPVFVNKFALYAPLASPHFTGTPTGITKAHVGLSNVDNTSDLNKPISTATQAALDAVVASSDVTLKADKTYVDAQLATKANSSDVTTSLSLKADSSALTSGLAAKANSTDVTTALALKADTSALTSGLALKADTSTVNTALGLKLTNSASTGILLGRYSAGTGVFQEITLGTNLSFSGSVLNASGGSAGANTSLSNLSGVSLNADLAWPDNGGGGAVARTITTGSPSAPQDLNGSDHLVLTSGPGGFGSSGNLYLRTAAATNNNWGFGTVNSGSVYLQIGSASNGPGGRFIIQDGSQGTSGQVWTSVDTAGTGRWMAAAGGSALTTQDEGSNLSTATTKINFAGAGVTATQPTANEILVTIPGGGGGAGQAMYIGFAYQTGTTTITGGSVQNLAYSNKIDPNSIVDISGGAFKFTVPAGASGLVKVKTKLAPQSSFSPGSNYFSLPIIYRTSDSLYMGAGDRLHGTWSGGENSVGFDFPQGEAFFALVPGVQYTVKVYTANTMINTGGTNGNGDTNYTFVEIW